MPLRTVVYLRRSTKDKDEKQIHSIDRQWKDIKKYLERHNKSEPDPAKKLKFDPEKDLFQEDASAKIVGRKKFNAMINRIQKNDYEVLLCTELTRISRNVVDNAAIVQILENKHLAEIRTLDKAFLSNPTDIFTLNLFLSVAKYENDMRALNTKSGLKRKTDSGGTAHRAPMGYRNEGSQKGEKFVVKDGNNAKKVRELWDLLLSESCTLKEIYDYALEIGVIVLRAKGVRKAPSDSTIYNMFRNLYYTGKVKKKDDQEKEFWEKGDHEQMVSVPEFDKAQLILQSKSRKHVKIDRAINYK